MTTHKELYTGKLSAGKRTYYFDVKESREGTKYLVISETESGSDVHHRIMVFEEWLKPFVSALQDAVDQIFLG